MTRLLEGFHRTCCMHETAWSNENGIIHLLAVYSEDRELEATDLLVCGRINKSLYGNVKLQPFSFFTVSQDIGIASVFDENHLGRSPSFSNSSASAASSSDCQYQLMCLDDKLMLELQSIGLHPERVPDLAEGEDEEIIKEIHELKKGLYQKVLSFC